MADTTIGLTVKADTGAAQQAFSKLTEKIREQTEAGDAAGQGQKGLARDLANTKAAQIEAAEAVRRAKSAQEEHNLTVGAFGQKSAQAKASEEALTKATKAQTEATEKASKSLEKTTKAVVDAAKAEGDQLSPATIRATKQVEALGKAAEKSAQDMRKTELASKQQAKSFDVMGFAGGKLMGILGPAALGGSIIALAGWLGEASQKTFQYETALANLPFSLDGVTKATHGMIDQQTLVASASSAVALGVTKTSAEFEALGAASVKLAAKLGQPADALLNNLVTALGRGSTELLDNAGIVLKVGDAHERYAASIGKTVEQLTAEEKAVAFKTEAFKAILESADKTKISYDSNAAALVRLKTTAGDAWDSIERGAVNAFGAIVAGAMSSADHLRKPIEAALEMQAAADLMNRELMRAQGWSQGFKDLASSAGESAIEMLNLGNVAANFQRVLGNGGLEKAIDGERQKAELITEEAKQAERLQRAMERIEKSNESFLDAQAEHELFIGPMPAEKKEKKKGPKKKKEEDVGRGLGEQGAVKAARVFDGSAMEVSSEPFYEREALLAQEAFDKKQALLERELELQDTRMGIQELAEVETIDRVFWSIERQTEAGAHREALINDQINREVRLARFQVKNARDEKTREEAQTKLEAAEHKKRMAIMSQSLKQQERDNSRKVAMFDKSNGAIMALGDTLVTALWERAEGEKGAVLHGLAELAKGTSKKLALVALEQTVLGVAAASGVFTAAAAAPHFAAAAIAAAGAAAAGGAAYGLGKAATAKGYDRKDTKEEKWQKQQDDKEAKAEWQEANGYGKPGKGGSGGGGGGSGRGGSGEGGDDDGIPTSYVERSNFNKRNQPTSPRKEGGGNVTNINVNNPQFLGATQTQVGVSLKRMMDNVSSSTGKTR